MELKTNLTWPQARALARGGAMVRPLPWTDRWVLWVGHIWWLLSMETGQMRVVTSTDFTKMEYLRADWTNIWPDQVICVFPPENPPVDPQPEPGGPIEVPYQFSTPTDDRVVPSAGGSGGGGRSASSLFTPQRLYGVRVVGNPFDVACSVWLHGLADDRLRLRLPGASGYIIASTDGSADWNYTATVDTRFVLGAGQSFTIAASNEGGGICKYNLTGVFTV